MMNDEEKPISFRFYKNTPKEYLLSIAEVLEDRAYFKAPDFKLVYYGTCGLHFEKDSPPEIFFLGAEILRHAARLENPYLGVSDLPDDTRKFMGLGGIPPELSLLHRKLTSAQLRHKAQKLRAEADKLSVRGWRE